MIQLNAIIVIILSHWIADFIFQTREMAENKSHSMEFLLKHIATYTVVLYFLIIFFSKLIPNSISNWGVLLPAAFAIINGFLHLVVDFFTSKLTSFLWRKELVHLFFITIGLDQALHMVYLFASYVLILNFL